MTTTAMLVIEALGEPSEVSTYGIVSKLRLSLERTAP